MNDLAAIVLAAGGSTRMGRQKQLLHFQGKSFLRRAVEAACMAGCSPVVVVLGCEAEWLRRDINDLPIEVVENADWERGMGTSIRRGVGKMLELAPTTRAAAILLADQPLITSDSIVKLQRAFVEGGRSVCVSAYAETIGPPVIVGRTYFPQLLTLPDEKGAKSIWEHTPEAVTRCVCDEGRLDVDTPEDYRELASRERW